MVTSLLRRCHALDTVDLTTLHDAQTARGAVEGVLKDVGSLVKRVLGLLSTICGWYVRELNVLEPACLHRMSTLLGDMLGQVSFALKSAPSMIIVERRALLDLCQKILTLGLKGCVKADRTVGTRNRVGGQKGDTSMVTTSDADVEGTSGDGASVPLELYCAAVDLYASCCAEATRLSSSTETKRKALPPALEWSLAVDETVTAIELLLQALFGAAYPRRVLASPLMEGYLPSTLLLRGVTLGHASFDEPFAVAHVRDVEHVPVVLMALRVVCAGLCALLDAGAVALGRHHARCSGVTGINAKGGGRQANMSLFCVPVVRILRTLYVVSHEWRCRDLLPSAHDDQLRISEAAAVAIVAAPCALSLLSNVMVVLMTRIPASSLVPFAGNAVSALIDTLWEDALDVSSPASCSSVAGVLVVAVRAVGYALNPSVINKIVQKMAVMAFLLVCRSDQDTYRSASVAMLAHLRDLDQVVNTSKMEGSGTAGLKRACKHTTVSVRKRSKRYRQAHVRDLAVDLDTADEEASVGRVGSHHQAEAVRSLLGSGDGHSGDDTHGGDAALATMCQTLSVPIMPFVPPASIGVCVAALCTVVEYCATSVLYPTTIAALQSIVVSILAHVQRSQLAGSYRKSVDGVAVGARSADGNTSWSGGVLAATGTVGVVSGDKPNSDDGSSLAGAEDEGCAVPSEATRVGLYTLAARLATIHASRPDACGMADTFSVHVHNFSTRALSGCGADPSLSVQAVARRALATLSVLIGAEAGAACHALHGGVAMPQSVVESLPVMLVDTIRDEFVGQALSAAACNPEALPLERAGTRGYGGDERNGVVAASHGVHDAQAMQDILAPLVGSGRAKVGALLEVQGDDEDMVLTKQGNIDETESMDAGEEEGGEMDGLDIALDSADEADAL